VKDDSTSGGPELVIVRRRGGEDAGAGKAGAWKIAYADFVTAMMAFFLVMWLINASNEKTRAQVASYFNPIKLTDTSTGERSLKDMNDSKSSEMSGNRRSAEDSLPSQKDLESESKLLANPAESLENIAKPAADLEYRSSGLESSVEIAPALRPDKSNPGVGDPFDPRAWEKLKAAPPGTPGRLIETKSPDDASPQSEIHDLKPALLQRENQPSDLEKQHARSTKSKTGDGEQDKDTEFEDEAKAIAKEIASRLDTSANELMKSLSVVPVASGILVSLTEGKNFEMFESGSAEPRPETIELVEAIASVVQSREGDIVIKGHTDSRPYRNRYYDNWQLSTARAHFARYMLIRGGLDERRIRKIEGLADREPRNSSDPQAAVNRRIEILIGRASE
jgi:chemotaxis protein MotB